MANIFLDFTDRKLENEYMKYSSQLKQNINFQTFVRSFCPEEMEIPYILYSPALEKLNSSVNNKTWTVNNLVLIPQRLSTANSILPEKLSVMMQGKILCQQHRYQNFKFIIESIQLIDSQCIPNSEMGCEIRGWAKNAFQNASFSEGSDFNGRDFSDNVIGMEVIESLGVVSPITNKDTAVAALDKWENYLKFRAYYVNSASSLSFHIDKCETINARMIRRGNYEQDIESAPFLDGHKEFGKKVKKDDFIYLCKEVDGDEACTILKLSIFEYKKNINPDADKSLRRLLRNQLLLSNSVKGEQPSDSKENKVLSLGNGNDIFIKCIETEIEPDYQAIEKEYLQKLQEGKKRIETDYKKKVENAVKVFQQNKEQELRSQLEEGYSKFAERLDNTLELEIEKNGDPQIVANLQYEAAKIAEREKVSIEEALLRIDISKIYRERNEKHKEEWRKEQENQLKESLRAAIKENRESEENRRKQGKQADLNNLQRSIENERENHKQQLAIEETKRLTEIYLFVDNIPRLSQQQNLSWMSWPYDEISYDPKMDQAKINRQKNTLLALREGRVANPMIAQYLFTPSSLPNASIAMSNDDIEWENKRLNTSQKEAVCKALSSSSLFLVQGPPGTGKTTVIAEITAQCVKRKMRVMIASETHKAIDNAFEDIESLNLPQARMLRILSGLQGNDNRWQEDRLTENFYTSIIKNLERQTDEYNYFDLTRDDFDKTLIQLQNQSLSLQQSKNHINGIRQEIDALNRKSNELVAEQNRLREKDEDWKDIQSELHSQINHIEQLCLTISEGEDSLALIDFKREVESLQAEEKYTVFQVVSLEVLMDIDTEVLRQEIIDLERPDKRSTLAIEREQIKGKMRECRDDLEDVKMDKQEEYELLRRRLLEIKEQERILEKNSSATQAIGANLKRLNIPNMLGDAGELRKLPPLLNSFQKDVNRLKEDALTSLRQRLKEEENAHLANQEVVAALQSQLENNQRCIDKFYKDEVLTTFNKTEREMSKAFAEFFGKFKVTAEYPKGDYDAALKIVENEWKKRCLEFDNNKGLFQARNSTLQSIKQYIQSGAIERDKPEMQPELINHINIFGITSTAKYDEIPRDFDVVIIDEVSKSSFLDLLRPIIRGKKVILVGDHMQLPPMYELKHLQEKDLEALDDDQISLAKNKEYAKLVETCYFKELFEKVPVSNKVMLDKQYRFHSQIMKLNPFYHEKLVLGDPNLDTHKQHGMEITINGKKIISPDTHICFVDCGISHESKSENTNSLLNEGEADVVVELLHQIGLQTGKKNDLSVGVICTYGMQAAIIKRKIKNDKSLLDLRKRDVERLIVSTVDDFQGDERDIIILSMVRNPTNWRNLRTRYNLDFIQEYQRINVAITRPRKLLIIVGAKDFLAEKALVSLPSESGKMQQDVHIFEKIINTVNREGRVVFMDDLVNTREYQQMNSNKTNKVFRRRR